MTFHFASGSLRCLPSPNGGSAFSAKCHCTINLISAACAVHLLPPCLSCSASLGACAPPAIGGGGKRKPPPMHHVRRLREPGKIHQRRRNCFLQGRTFLRVFPVKFLRLSRDTSHVRVPGYCSSPFPRGKSVLSVEAWLPTLLETPTLYQKIRPADENFTAVFARRDLRPQAYPGSLCRTLLLSILIYERSRRI